MLKITPENTKIENFAKSMGMYGRGLAGELCIDNVIVGSFNSQGRGEGLDTISILDADVEQQMEDYQKENEKNKDYQTVEGFILTAIDLHLISKEVEELIEDFSRESKEETVYIGAYLFRNETGFSLTMYNHVPVDPSDDELHAYKILSRQHKDYTLHKEAYFIKYNSEHKLILKRMN